MTTTRTIARGLTSALALLVLLVALLTVLAASARAARCTTADSPYAIATSGNQKTAAATDGEIAVWAEKVGGEWVIMGRSLDSARTRNHSTDAYRITDAGSEPSSLETGDGYVVWQEGAAPDSTVWVSSTCAGSEAECLAGRAAEPAIGSGIIAWVDFTGGSGDLVGLVVSDLCAEPVILCDDVSAQRSPSVCDDMLAWQDDRNGTWDIYAAPLYSDVSPWDGGVRCESPELTPGAEFVICAAAGDQTRPSVWHGVVVWQDRREADADVWAAWRASDLDQAMMGSSGAGGRTITASKLVVHRLSAGDGDQLAPVVADGKVVWEEESSGDLGGYDLVKDSPVVTCTAPGAQCSPSAGGGTVVWLDLRDGDQIADVWGADLDALGGGGDDPSPIPDWTDEDVITVFLALFADLGIFDEVAFSTDGGESYGEWQPIGDVAELPLPDGEGIYRIALLFRDSAGREFGPVMFTVRLDTHAPCAQPRHAARLRGGAVALRFKVHDNMSPRARVMVQVRSRTGRVLRTVTYRAVKTRIWVTKRIELPSGAALCRLRATDLAGNVQKRAAGVRLTR